MTNNHLTSSVALPEISESREVLPHENRAIETEFFEEQIKTIFTVRMKILHLSMSWKKFITEGRPYGTNRLAATR